VSDTEPGAERGTDVTAGARAGQDPEQMEEFARRLEQPPPPVDEEWEITRADTDGSEQMEGEAPTG
jgi:hypothetical protein